MDLAGSKVTATRMKVRPLVSVIMAAYNTADYVAAAVESALGQTYSPLEVIVVDDGSTDGTCTVLTRYGDRIKLIRQKNAGPAAARNRAIEAASGEFMAILDSDDIWLSDKLERQMVLVEQCPELDLVFSKGTVMDETGSDLMIPLPEVVPKALSLQRIMKDGYVLDQDWQAVLGCVNFIPHMSIVARLSSVRAVGGYDPQLWCTEDYHLYMRLAACGACFGFLDCPTFRARRRSAQITGDRSFHREHRKNALIKLLSGSWHFSPAVRRELRRSLAALPKKAGDRAFCEGDRRTARKCYLEAFHYWPRAAQIASWGATFLGPAAPRVMALINHGSDVFDELLEKDNREPPRVSD